MADNFTTVDASSATITGAADEIGGVKFPRVKLIIGADGTNDGDVASGNPLPAVLTAGAAAIGKLAANSGVDIGDVDVTSCALPTGAATAAKQLPDGHNVVVTTCALPTGASTAAKQPALGTAGTASADVITVQGVASMTPLLATVTATNLDVRDLTSASDSVAAVCTNAGTFAVQAACTLGAETTKVIGTVNVAAAQTIAVTQGTASSLKCEEASASAIKTAVETIDNAISGSEMQVDVVAALPAGTNNIGDVDVLSFANGKTIKRAVISGATSGNNTIVTAVADKKIKVLSVFLIAATAVTVRFESGAGGTALTGVMSIGATGGFVLPPPADPTNHWFETGVNTLLNMELGGAVQVSGAITYYEEA